MRTVALLSALLITYFMYGFYLSQVSISVIPTPIASIGGAGSFPYKGVLNVLSSRSTGTAKPESIVVAAKNAGMDFVIFTDLTPDSPEPLLKSYSGTTVLMDAQKINYLDSHFFYLSPNGFDARNEVELQTKMTDYLTQIKPLAHQLLILTQPRLSNFTVDNIPAGIHGVEVFNIKDVSSKAWQESKSNVLWSLLIYPFNPKLAFLRLFNEPEENWAYFDKIAAKRRLIAFAGAEASAKAFPWSNFLLRFPSYQRIFEMLSLRVLLKSELTGIYSDDYEKIFEALQNGHFFTSLDLLGDPKDFSAVIKDDHKKYNMGDQIQFRRNMVLEVKVPQPNVFYEVIVWKDGEKFAVINKPEFSLPIKEPGVYRVQVRVSPYLPLPDAKKWFSWIYTNPFFVE